MKKEFLNLLVDIRRITRSNRFIFLNLFFQRAFWAVFLYRMERIGFNCFGKYYKFARIPFLPLLFIFNVIHNCEIHYLARIGPGFIILHPSLGLVISAKAIIGSRATFNGGNVIGSNYKNSAVNDGIQIMDNLEMGVNAVIVGPIKIADNTVIGANTIVTKSILGLVLRGLGIR